jgi:hypothetical protein
VFHYKHHSLRYQDLSMLFLTHYFQSVMYTEIRNVYGKLFKVLPGGKNSLNLLVKMGQCFRNSRSFSPSKKSSEDVRVEFEKVFVDLDKFSRQRRS